jgi:hypothetical protein
MHWQLRRLQQNLHNMRVSVACLSLRLVGETPLPNFARALMQVCSGHDPLHPLLPNIQRTCVIANNFSDVTYTDEP